MKIPSHFLILKAVYDAKETGAKDHGIELGKGNTKGKNEIQLPYRQSKGPPIL